MLLKTKKKIAKLMAVFTLAAGVAYEGGQGAIALDHAIEAAHARHVAEQAQKAADDRIALAAVVKADTQTLHQEGYDLTQQISAGRACEQGGTTDGAGYVGSETAVAYIANFEGRTGKVCVAHPGGQPVHAKFKRMVTPGLDESGTLKQLMETDVAEFRDRDTLAARGFQVTGALQQAGSACRDDGTTNGDGYHGAATSIAYNAQDKLGHTGQVCTEHTTEGILNRAQFSPSLRF